jgi:hypothetical protein
MQTYLPYENFLQCAATFDDLTLKQQCIDAHKILRNLCGLESGYEHHPVVHMWFGNEMTLAVYGLTVCEEWRRRGNKDLIFDKIKELMNMPQCRASRLNYPFFLSDLSLHSAYRANLLFIMPDHYKKFGWKEKPLREGAWSLNNHQILFNGKLFTSKFRQNAVDHYIN